MFLPTDKLPRMSLSHHNTLYLKQPLQKATRFIPLRQLELPIGLWNVVVYCVYCGNLDASAVHVAASCEWCGCLFCLSLMFLQRFDWLRLDLALIQTCLWSCELNVALWVMTCWTSGWQFAGWFFQCSLLDMPRMSLSHHNTLYLKQPLLKATRFIPLRQLELPIGLWNVVVYCVYCGNLDTSAVHVAASCEWCGCLFCLSLMFLQRFDWLQLDLA